MIGFSKLPSGNAIPKFGIGTWPMGSKLEDRRKEIDAIRLAMDHGVTLLDTAEMYADGGAERVAAEAIKGQRDKVYLTTKVLPSNASYQGTIEACERSLKNLDTDRVELYLLHWVGPHPVEETLRAFQKLKQDGKIQDYGVSNFDLSDMETWPDPEGLATNQIYYNLKVRAAEWSVIPWCKERQVPLMAYSPLDKQGSFLSSAELQKVADRHEATTAQIAIAWLYQQEGIIPIPKSSDPERLVQNIQATEILFEEEDWQLLDRAFPAPTGPQPLPST